MRILLYSISYHPEPSGIGPYSAGLAETLVGMGHEVHVIAANPSYPYWKRFDGYPALGWTRRSEGGVTVHRCPVYVPGKVNGATRILHYLSYAAAALFPSMKLAFGFRPQAVLHVVPTLVASPLVLAVAKLSGAKSWLHVQDFEVEAAFATGQMAGGGRLARLALAFERACIRCYDRTSSISLEMCRKLVEKGQSAETVHELRNWAELGAVRPHDDSDYRARWAVTTPHVALYSGSIARKQGIDIILDAARRLAARPDLTFVICGDGPERAELERLASGMANVQIHGLQPKEQLGDLLNLATVHLLPQKADAADLVLPSKLTNMLASGRPVVATAAPGTGLAREVEGAGLVTPPGDVEAFAAAIARLVDDAAERKALGIAARARAEQVWDRDNILQAFEHSLRRAVGA